VELRGLRQHQERVFQCFGVDPLALHRSGPVVALPADEAAGPTHKVA
jgi:hypothetical protein